MGSQARVIVCAPEPEMNAELQRFGLSFTILDRPAYRTVLGSWRAGEFGLRAARASASGGAMPLAGATPPG
jgi:hypothetical protein